MIKQLIAEWQEALAQETDTKKYRLIMRTIAFLQSIDASVDMAQPRISPAAESEQ